MKIAFVCKRRYMSKDVIFDRYARLYEIPRQLAECGHNVLGLCAGYQGQECGEWAHPTNCGELRWQSYSVSARKVWQLASLPSHFLGALREFKPDLLIGASDMPHSVLTAWLSRKLDAPYVIDLYDNFEGFGQAKIPLLTRAFRNAVRNASLVTTTSEPLRQMIVNCYRFERRAIAMPSSVDLSIFNRTLSKARARELLGLPQNVPMVGTAGHLHKDKGFDQLLAAWPKIQTEHPTVHLVLAGPLSSDIGLPTGERVHYLGMLPHESVAALFRSLDVGVITIPDTEFGRFSFPQKAYEMLACGLPVTASAVGAMTDLFATAPQALYDYRQSDALASQVQRQLAEPQFPAVDILDWRGQIAQVEPMLRTIGASRVAQTNMPEPLR